MPIESFTENELGHMLYAFWGVENVLILGRNAGIVITIRLHKGKY